MSAIGEDFSPGHMKQAQFIVIVYGETSMLEGRRRRVIDDTTPVDWKNAEWLRKFITESGRILPRRMTGNSQPRQREIARAIKRARHMALLPFGRQSEY
ncbi:MAG: 30S ribosomal protein S18 [Nitrospira sp.]|nr:30S ribosomal protein S18 [Nitrospira sp.]